MSNQPLQRRPRMLTDLDSRQLIPEDLLGLLTSSDEGCLVFSSVGLGLGFLVLDPVELEVSRAPTRTYVQDARTRTRVLRLRWQRRDDGP